MNNTRLTFNSSTNFTLPIGVFRVLQRDAYYYGFVKNGQPNISGFLNNLIPALSDYQEDLFYELLKYNNGNVEKAKICARSIHKVYLHPFTFHDDGIVNVPFRISKDKYGLFAIRRSDTTNDAIFRGYRAARLWLCACGMDPAPLLGL